MLESGMFMFIYYLVCALVAVGLARLTLLWFDLYLVPAEFKEWLRNADPMARAVYHVGRFFGICHLFASILG